MPVPTSRRWVLGLVCLVATSSGCEPFPREALVIATSWPADDRRRIEEAFVGWLDGHGESSGQATLRIEWLILAPGDDLVGLAGRRHPPDVLLGGPVRSYARLALAKRLSPLPIDGSPEWAVSRRTVIRVVSDPEEPPRPLAAGAPHGVSFDDPRKDPISLAWAEALVTRGRFGEGYARLVRAAGDRRRIGRRPGSASAAAGRGAADFAVGIAPEREDADAADAIPWAEGVAIVAGGHHREWATRFLRFLAETNRLGPASIPPERASSDTLELLAELLGATLVDAQDELWSAWAALERAGSPGAQLRSMTEPPPWPPASIARILDRQDEPAMAMVETLAGQLATDPGARALLISSWLSPPRHIDVQVLEELARAADGRLFREPRFRGWLRAEWTAWARQRYRRVSRSLSHPGGRGAAGSGIGQGVGRSLALAGDLPG